MKEVTRTRFAPSPTGMLHIGAVRTAMFAWLIARQAGGQFILRIEDTDKKRETEGGVQNIIDSLNWLGIDRDEGPITGGDYGPYYQSERLEFYKRWADRLIEKGVVYADTSTPQQVQEWRDADRDSKRPFLFRNHCPDRESLPDDWYGKYPLRLRIDNLGRVDWHDEVFGDLSAGEDSLDDFILIKADKYPTYNFAHIVDDHEMQISHIVRGEEFISSMPKFIRLYEALGIEHPSFVTVPPILGKSGGKKLSKRDGAAGALDYRDQGYTVDAIWNFLCLIGWNDGTTDEIFTREDLTQRFAIDKIQKSAGRFDLDRLDWISGHHIRNMDVDKLLDTIDKYDTLTGTRTWPTDDSLEHRLQILGLVHEKLKSLAEAKNDVELFYEYQPPSLEMMTKLFDTVQGNQILNECHSLLSGNDAFVSIESIEQLLRKYVQENELKTGKVFRLIRAAVTGREIAPGLFETIYVLGQPETLKRLELARKSLKSA